jgi:aminocarboxymuconate-semialdehyde decarboxylase
MAIDMHAHWTPRGLFAASDAGRDWYGWRIVYDRAGNEYVNLGDRMIGYGATASRLNDPAARSQARKAEGVHLEGLVLTGTYWNYHLDENDAVRFCREVNEEVAEVQRAFPRQYRGMAVLPMQHPKAALRELDYAIEKLDLRTVVIGSNIRGLNLDDPEVIPILEVAAQKDVSICVHPTIWDKAADLRLPRYYFVNSFGAPLESSLALMSIVYSGLLDRHPNLRIMFTQGGGWIHFGVGRFMLRYTQRPDSRPMAQPPVEYLSRAYYDCLVHDLDSLALLVKRATPDRVMIGTDYQAGGDILGGAVNWIKGCDFLSPADKDKILWRNAATFLGLDAEFAREPSSEAAKAPEAL